MATDSESLLVQEDYDQAPFPTQTGSSRRRLVLIPLAVLGVACVFAFLAWKPSQVAVMGTNVVQYDGELPDIEFQKEDFEGTPIYEEPSISATSSKVWTIRMPEESSTADIEAAAGDLPENLKEVYKGDPDSGGVAILMVKGTLGALKDWLHGGILQGTGFVEQDGKMALIPDDEEEGRRRRLASSWGIDRVDERNLPLDNSFVTTGTGEGTHVYVLDTGIRTTHEEFGGRANPLVDFSKGKVCRGQRVCAADTIGHGTHCAGTVGGSSYGVARKATMHAMKVIGDDGSGDFSWFNQAIDWIVTKGERPAVASASLRGFGRLRTTEMVIDNALRQGVVVVVAAGNEGKSSKSDACQYTPPFVASAITVGSSTKTDDRSSFSNIGNCVDLFAPGSEIISASHEDDSSPATESGTSMAAPHVAGAVAVLMQEGTKAADVVDELISRSTKNSVHDVRGAPNYLLFVGNVGGKPSPSPAPTPPPVPGKCETLGWKILSGDCAIKEEGCCLMSPGFEDGAKYRNSQECKVQVGTDPGPIKQESFDTELDYDYLEVNGQKFWGEEGPHDILPRATLTWSSDRSASAKGFKLCLPRMGQPGGCDEAMSGKGADYRGCQTKTRGGHTCQKWTEQSPHEHSRTPQRFPNKGLGAHNFCRNPDNEDGIWCYVADKSAGAPRWEYCDPAGSMTPAGLVIPWETINGKQYKAHPDCMKGWKAGKTTIAGYCTGDYHPEVWCSKESPYKSEWALCTECTREGGCTDADADGAVTGSAEHA